MGNRIDGSIPIEQATQCDARTGICQPTRFQTDAYQDKVSDRAAQGQQMVARELGSVLSRLQNAQDAFAQHGMRAAIPEYGAAIRAADSIDQKAVAQERATIKELLKNKNLDDKTRRILVQEDADLHTLQRAPGFARANFALLTIRSGDQFNGTQLLLEAQKKDFEMSRDPNFQRHLRYAIESKPVTVQEQNPRAVAQQRLSGELPQQPAPPPQYRPGDPRVQIPATPQMGYQPPYERFQPNPPIPQTLQPNLQLVPRDPRLQPQPVPQQFVPGDPRLQPQPVPQQFVPGDPRLQPQPVPQQFIPGDPRLRPQPVPQQFVPGDPRLQPQPTYQLPSDVHPLQRQSQQPDVTPLRLPVGRFAPLDAQGRSPVEAVQALLGSVTGPKTMTAEVRQQFQAAIKNADTGVSPKLAFLQQQETLAANALKPLMGPETAKVMVGFDQAVSNACQQMSPDKRQAAVQLYSSIDKAPNLAERQQVQKQLVQLNPALEDLLKNREQSLGAANIQLLLNYNAFKNAVQTEKNQVAITRFMFGLALSKNGDGNEAKQHIALALKLNRDPELTIYWKGMAAQLGVPTDKIQPPAPVPVGGMQPPLQPGAERGKPPAPADLRAVQPDAAKPLLDGVNPENQGLRPDQILSNARRSLQQNGMTDATKKQFEDAIKTADATFTPANKEVADKLIVALQTGKKHDGSVLQPQERMQAHQFINNEIQNSVSGVAIRLAYSELLSQNKQYASAGKMLQESTAAADRLPFEIYRAELDQLSKDLKNPVFNRASNADLLKMVQTLRGGSDSKEDGLIFLPIIARKQAAEFYLTGKDGQPGVLQPTQAVALIDDAKARVKQLYNVDLDSLQNWDPRLVTLAKESSKYLPENLLKEKAKADTFWSNALIDGGTAAVVFVAAGFAASAITKNPAFARMGLTTGEGALTLGGKATIASGMLLSATAGRHYTHALVTGDNESWYNSAIHGTAGVAGVAAIIGTRGQVNQVLFKGATEEAMWLRATQARGTVAPVIDGVASAQKSLTVADAAAICAERNIVLSEKAKQFLAVPENGARILFKDGAIADSAAYEAMKLGLNPAQAATMAKSFVSVTASGSKVPFFSRASLAGMAETAYPLRQLDLATASSAQLSIRSFYSGYTSAFAGLGTYSSVAAMDRSINPTTGKQFSYGEQFMENNFRDRIDNTPVRAALIGLTPLLRDGAIAKNMFVADASAVKRGLGYAKSPFVPSGMGAVGEGATYVDLGRQAGYLSIASTIYDPAKIVKFFEGRDKSAEIGRNLHAIQIPVEDFKVPIPQK